MADAGVVFFTAALTVGLSGAVDMVFTKSQPLKVKQRPQLTTGVNGSHGCLWWGHGLLYHLSFLI
jgi:hypothetical protein